MAPPGARPLYALVKDFSGAITGSEMGLALLASGDGIAWEPGRYPPFTPKQLLDARGRRIPVARLERPQLLVAADGTPRVLYAACSLEPCNDKRDGSTSNVQIVLRRHPDARTES